MTPFIPCRAADSWLIAAIRKVWNLTVQYPVAVELESKAEGLYSIHQIVNLSMQRCTHSSICHN